MTLDEKQLAFLEQTRAAAMITPTGDGFPRAVRVGIAHMAWCDGAQPAR